MIRAHHIGYLVKNPQKAAAHFAALGYVPRSESVDDTGRGVDIRFLENGDCCVELVTPNRADSVVSGLMERRKNSPYHLCLSSDCFLEDLALLREQGFLPVDEPTPAPALGGRRVVFLMSPQIGLVELMEDA